MRHHTSFGHVFPTHMVVMAGLGLLVALAGCKPESTEPQETRVPTPVHSPISPITTGSSPVPTPADEPPSTDLGIAPDFTLPQASADAFTLYERLADEPVVLVFFQQLSG